MSKTRLVIPDGDGVTVVVTGVKTSSNLLLIVSESAVKISRNGDGRVDNEDPVTSREAHSENGAGLPTSLSFRERPEKLDQIRIFDGENIISKMQNTHESSSPVGDGDPATPPGDCGRSQPTGEEPNSEEAMLSGESELSISETAAIGKAFGLDSVSEFVKRAEKSHATAALTRGGDAE